MIWVFQLFPSSLCGPQDHFDPQPSWWPSASVAFLLALFLCRWVGRHRIGIGWRPTSMCWSGQHASFSYSGFIVICTMCIYPGAVGLHFAAVVLSGTKSTMLPYWRHLAISAFLLEVLSIQLYEETKSISTACFAVLDIRNHLWNLDLHSWINLYS